MSLEEHSESSTQKPKKNAPKILSLSLLFVLVSFAVVVVFQAARNVSLSGLFSSPVTDVPVFGMANENAGIVLAETDEQIPANVLLASASSENFRAGEIAIGGEADFLLDERDVNELKIEGVRSEVVVEKGGKNVRLVVVWKTTRPTLGEVRYGKSRIEIGKKVTEEVYSANHGAIISGLEQAATYLYTIKAYDRFGNEVESDAYAVYTGAKNVSLVDLISNAAKDVFSWAIK